MAIGHYIRRGDRTTCGGVVLEGNPSFSMHGVPVARAGDTVTCGKDGQHYVIAGGFQHFMIGGSVAGTLDSVSTCPCRARLIHSLPSATYQSGRAFPETISEPASASSRSVTEMQMDKPMAAVDRSVGTASVFAKCCKLPDSVIDYSRPSGSFPIDSARDFGNLVLLGGREVDESGSLSLKKISGNVPSGIGSFNLRGLAADPGASCGRLCDVASAGGALTTGARVVTGAGGRVVGGGILSGGVVGGALLGVVAMLWPSSLGDSALYTEEKLRSMKQARTRVRIRVETQPDGTLKGYGYNTELRRDWEMIPVVQFAQIGSQMVADFGGGVELIWTPAANPADTLGIPALDAAPQAPQITIYPPTEQTDNLIVDPVYPPEYRDFILVFPAGSEIAPLYIVMNARHDLGVVTGQGKDVTGIWLAEAGTGLGSPIPTRIADDLRGKSFSNFDSFRKALWKAVSRDVILMEQLNRKNQALVRNGKAPFAPMPEHNGENMRYELHHIENIQYGGAVYNIDNISIATPKRHVEIHREDRS